MQQQVWLSEWQGCAHGEASCRAPVLASAGVTLLDIDNHLTLNSSCERGCSPAALYLHTHTHARHSTRQPLELTRCRGASDHPDCGAGHAACVVKVSLASWPPRRGAPGSQSNNNPTNNMRWRSPTQTRRCNAPPAGALPSHKDNHSTECAGQMRCQGVQ